MRPSLRDQQRARDAGAPVSEVVHDRFAYVFGKRHAVVQLAFATDEDFPGAPVDIIKLDRDDLGSAKSQPRCEQQQRVIAPPHGVVGSHRFYQPLDLFGL